MPTRFRGKSGGRFRFTTLRPKHYQTLLMNCKVVRCSSRMNLNTIWSGYVKRLVRTFRQSTVEQPSTTLSVSYCRGMKVVYHCCVDNPWRCHTDSTCRQVVTI